jgi:hypothetical protein
MIAVAVAVAVAVAGRPARPGRALCVLAARGLIPAVPAGTGSGSAGTVRGSGAIGAGTASGRSSGQEIGSSSTMRSGLPISPMRKGSGENRIRSILRSGGWGHGPAPGPAFGPGLAVQRPTLRGTARRRERDEDRRAEEGTQ